MLALLVADETNSLRIISDSVAPGIRNRQIICGLTQISVKLVWRGTTCRGTVYKLIRAFNIYIGLQAVPLRPGSTFVSDRELGTVVKCVNRPTIGWCLLSDPPQRDCIGVQLAQQLAVCE